MPTRPSLSKIATRLHVEESLAAGRSIGLDPGRAHFLRTVLRLQKGAPLALFNAQDGEWLARIDCLGKGWCSVDVVEQRRGPSSEPDLWLLFAPVKRARIDFIAEKATEMGCALLQPVITRYTDVSRVNRDRLAVNAREAAEQCERLSVPEVAEPKDLRKLLAEWPSDRRILLCVESGEARPIAEVLQKIKLETHAASGQIEAREGGETRFSGPWAILTGPEGGFDPEERAVLRQLPFVIPVGLGPRILRADTAAVAALACWQAILGDADVRPPERE